MLLFFFHWYSEIIHHVNSQDGKCLRISFENSLQFRRWQFWFFRIIFIHDLRLLNVKNANYDVHVSKVGKRSFEHKMLLLRLCDNAWNFVLRQRSSYSITVKVFLKKSVRKFAFILLTIEIAFLTLYHISHSLFLRKSGDKIHKF